MQTLKMVTRLQTRPGPNLVERTKNEVFLSTKGSTNNWWKNSPFIYVWFWSGPDMCLYAPMGIGSLLLGLARSSRASSGCLLHHFEFLEVWISVYMYLHFITCDKTEFISKVTIRLWMKSKMFQSFEDII